MSSEDGAFNLGEKLARQLKPTVVVIAATIILVFPLTFLLVEYHALRKTALLYAFHIADDITEGMLQNPRLWKYQVYRHAKIIQDRGIRQEVASIVVYDESGSSVPCYEWVNDRQLSWLNRIAPYALAPLRYNGQDAGRVQVRMNHWPIVWKTSITGLVSAAVGILLSLFAYILPLRAVRKLEAEIGSLIRSLRSSEAESAQAQLDAELSGKRYRELLQEVDAVVWEGDPASQRFTFMSGQAETLLGHAPEVWLAQPMFFTASIHPEDRERVLGFYRSAATEGDTSRIEYRRIKDTGVVVWVADRVRWSRDVDGQILLKGIMVDVTRRKQAEDDINAKNRALTRWVTELEKRNREINVLNEMGELFHTCHNMEEASAIIRKTFGALFPGGSGSLAFLQSGTQLVETAVTWGEAELHAATFPALECWAMRRKKLHTVEREDSVLACNHHCGGHRAYFCIPFSGTGVQDGVFCFTLPVDSAEEPAISHDRKQLALAAVEHISLALANLTLRETLQYHSTRDSLTGLFNRRYMEETLDRELSRVERDGTGLAVVIIDIDHFKNFNDTHGHAAGDVVLREFAAYLQKSIREYDIPCRYGGEEFILIVPDLPLSVAEERIDELRKGVEALQVLHHGYPLPGVTISVGIARYPEHALRHDDLLRAADAALYAAKTGGRNQVKTARHRKCELVVRQRSDNAGRINRKR